MTELLGIRAYARHRGVSHVAVLKAIEAGRLKRSVVASGRSKKLDKHLADQEWETMTNGAKVRPRASRKGGRPKQGSLPGMDGDAAASAGEDHGEGTGGLTHAKASAFKVAMDAKIRELEYEERVGRLLDRRQVEKEAYELARGVRDSVMAVPERLTNLSAEQRAELGRELRAALKALEAKAAAG